MTENKPIDAIKIGTRHRRDMGDIDGFAADINRIGLLHPVVITPAASLSRASAVARVERLGWLTIPARVIDIELVARGEFPKIAAVRTSRSPRPSPSSALWNLSSAKPRSSA